MKDDWLFLANTYWNFGTHRGFMSYVCAGIGASRINLSSFSDTNENAGRHHWASDYVAWHFAWAVHAGFSYDISPDLKFGLGCHFTWLGDGKTGSFQTYDVTASLGPLIQEDITSHDILVGRRWNFGDGCCIAPEAVPINYAPPTTFK